MSKHIFVLLVFLALLNLQVFAQKTCLIETTASPSEPTATVSLFNDVYKPDCLTVYSNQTIKWGMRY